MKSCAVMPPSRSERALGRFAPAWRWLPVPLAVVLALLPLPLCPLVGLGRSGAWPWDEPLFWLLLLPTLAAWQMLLWLPLRRLALTARDGLPPLTPRERWPGVLAGAVLLGGATALTLGALCELFRWRSDTWIIVQGVLALASAGAWAWLLGRHRLAGNVSAHHGHHLARLTLSLGASLTISALCLVLIDLREPMTPEREPAKVETRKPEPAKSETSKHNFWSQVRDTFRDGRQSPEVRETPAPSSWVNEREPTPSARGNVLIQAPSAAGCGVLAGLFLAMLLPGILTLIARRRECARGTPDA